MGKDIKDKSSQIICELILRNRTMRDFAKQIGEAATDISLWKRGARQIRPRAVIEICRHYPDIKPHDLNPYVFTKDIILTFKNKAKK
jgi:DNA-binding transcriptional regulator YdaS (Cro superfamily)